jgi:plasmid stability protein
MRRIAIEIDDEMHQALKARASRERRSIADLIRESIAMTLRNTTPRSSEEFGFVGSGYCAADRKDLTSENHDRALANAFSVRRGRR